MPRGTRIRIIMAFGLLLAGTEAAALAPQIFDIAVMIDVFGLTFMLAVFLKLPFWYFLARFRRLYAARYSAFLFMCRNPRVPLMAGAVLLTIAMSVVQSL